MRTLSLTAAAAALLACAAPAAQEPAAPSLNGAVAGCFTVGTALGPRQLTGGPAMTALIAEQFGVLTPDNAMKWARIHPAPGRYDFRTADRLVAFAEENGMDVVGHTLMWHSQVPPWVFEDEDGGPITRDALLSRLEGHIGAVAGRYAGRIRGWDVVNEAVNDDGSMRDTPWRRILGEGAIETAFRLAASADPEAELYYNDYNMTDPRKRDAVVAMVADLKAKGVRVDGIGMQGHVGLDRPSLEDFAAAIDAYAALGVKVMITELDMTVLPWPDTLAVGADISAAAENRAELDPYTDGLPGDVARAQADRYAALFDLLVSRRDAIDRVTFWGVDDGGNWKNDFPVRGRTDHPMLFARDLAPKPAFGAVIAKAGPCRG